MENRKGKIVRLKNIQGNFLIGERIQLHYVEGGHRNCKGVIANIVNNNCIILDSRLNVRSGDRITGTISNAKGDIVSVFEE